MTHSKRISAPIHYPTERKGLTYVSELKDSRSPDNSVPAVLMLRDILEYADTKKEAKKIIRNGEILRNGEPLRDVKEGIGVLDTVKIPEAEETYRVFRRGTEMVFEQVEDGGKHVAKIIDKEVEGEKYVYRLHNGENFSSNEEFNVGSTLVFNGEGAEEVPLEGGKKVIATEGSHAGKKSELEDIKQRKMDKDIGVTDRFETLLENLVAVQGFETGDPE